MSMKDRPDIETLDDALAYINELEADLEDQATEVWPLVIALDSSIQLGKKGEEISEITIREPVLRDLRGIDTVTVQGVSQVKMADVIQIASKLTGMQIALLHKLPMRPAARLMKVARGFLTDCL